MFFPQVCTAIYTGTQIHAKENSKSTAHLIFEATMIMVKKNDANLSEKDVSFGKMNRYPLIYQLRLTCSFK